MDFLAQEGRFRGDVITNPPYRHALEFVEKALEVIGCGRKAAFFLKLQFLEGKARRRLFDASPPRRIYVSSGRLTCAMNGDFARYSKSSAVSYAWFVWEKGFRGEPSVRWFN